MATEAGVVYHPGLDDEIRRYPGGRVFLVRSLKQLADEHNSAGDCRLRMGDYDGANRYWSLAARHIRAAQSIGFGRSTNPEDYAIVATAWRRAVEAASLEKVANK